VNAPIDLVPLLRARDGDRCWLCGAPMDFNAKPNSANAWSVEHLLSRSLGGPHRLENAVLCHPRCNRVLGCRALHDKIRLRDRRLRKGWIAALGPRIR